MRIVCSACMGAAVFTSSCHCTFICCLSSQREVVLETLQLLKQRIVPRALLKRPRKSRSAQLALTSLHGCLTVRRFAGGGSRCGFSASCRTGQSNCLVYFPDCFAGCFPSRIARASICGQLPESREGRCPRSSAFAQRDQSCLFYLR